MSKKIPLSILVIILIGFGYVTFFNNETVVINNQGEKAVPFSAGGDNLVQDPTRESSFYENGDDVICTVNQGVIESIYYFSDNQARMSGLISGQEANAIYKDGIVYTWSVTDDGTIFAANRYQGETAREDNLAAFGPKDYGSVCESWLEVDRSIFELPVTEFTTINN